MSDQGSHFYGDGCTTHPQSSEAVSEAHSAAQEMFDEVWQQRWRQVDGVWQWDDDYLVPEEHQESTRHHVSELNRLAPGQGPWRLVRKQGTIEVLEGP